MIIRCVEGVLTGQVERASYRRRDCLESLFYRIVEDAFPLQPQSSEKPSGDPLDDDDVFPPDEEGDAVVGSPVGLPLRPQAC